MAEKKTKTVKVGKKIRASAPEPVGASVEELETEIPTEIPNLVDELVNDLKKTEETNPTPPPTDHTNKKRSELIKLSEDGEITQSVGYIRKASVKVVDKQYAEYEARRMERANEFLTDILISRFSNVLGGLESSEELDNELQKDKLLKSDVGKVVAMITPYIPCLGLLSGGVTVGKHVYQHKTKLSEQKSGSK